MSLSFEDIVTTGERYNKIKEKVISAVGFNALNSNHINEAILYNVRIDENTTKEEIIDICSKFFDLYDEIEELFKKNDVEFKDDYFSNMVFDGYTTFLCKSIDVYKGIAPLKKTINDYFKLYKKIHKIASEYRNLGNIELSKSVRSGNEEIYYLYGHEILLTSKDYVIDEILYNYDALNRKINNLLKVSGYKKKNQLYAYYDGEYYLFGEKIDRFTKSDKLLEIINKAQLFENRFKLALNELCINKKYTIEYKNHILVEIADYPKFFDLDATYEEIKKYLLKTD